MKKIKYITLFAVTLLQLTILVLSFYYAFFAKNNSVMRIYQFMACFVETNEEVLSFIEESIPQYTNCFILFFSFSIITFGITLAILIYSLKKERPVQEWLKAHRADKERKAQERKAAYISELEKKLNELKKDGE